MNEQEIAQLLRETAFEPTPWTPLAVLLDDVVAFVRRFVVMSDEQAETVALWTAHTHPFEGDSVPFDTTPYLLVTSPEKRSGKTRLFEVLELLVYAPLPTANISDAALFRAVGELSPTLLLDEIDAIFGAKARDREDLRGMLNAGHRRGAVVRRMGGPKMTTLEAFPVFCAKAFAGIGHCLPETILDRSIPIRLHRKTRSEPVERFRRRDVEEEARELSARLATWADSAKAELEQARPALPDELNDRALDAWEPLLAIADLAEGSWPERARRAALALSGGEQREDESLAVRLLADLHRVFHPSGGEPVERLATSALLDALHADDEGPWASYGRSDKSLTPAQLARLLRPFDIHSRSMRFDDGTNAKGYLCRQFEDAWQRYVTAESASQPSQRHNPRGYAENGRVAAVTRDGTDAAQARMVEPCDVVTAREPSHGLAREDEDPDDDEIERVADLLREAES